MQTIEEQRDDLRTSRGFTLTDSLKRYDRIASKTEEGNPFAAIQAQQRIDKLLGYEAPAEININERRELSTVIQVIHSLGVSPRELDHLLIADQQEIGTNQQVIEQVS